MDRNFIIHGTNNKVKKTSYLKKNDLLECHRMSENNLKYKRRNTG